jgi:Tol biopolymer transport system component
LPQVPAVAVSLVVVVVLAAGAGSMGGAAAATHTAAQALAGNANSPNWSPNGKQVAFAYLGDPAAGRYRIVRESSTPGAAVHTVLAAPYAKYGCCDQMRWVTGGRILVDASGGLRSVSVLGGKPNRIALGGGLMGFLLSPDRKIAAAVRCGCTGFNSDQEIELVRLPPKGRPVVLQTQLWGEILAFSPDSKEVVFEGASGLMAAGIAAGTQVPLPQSGIPGASLVPNDVRQLRWSPDGRWLAFAENQNLEVVPTTGAGEPRVLATNFGTGPDAFDGFSWSPDSSVIAYTCCDSQGPQHFMTVRPDGTHLTDLLQGRGLQYVWRTGGITLGPTLAPFPQWSPDSSRLLFLASDGSGRPTHVWTIRRNGRGLTRLG